MINDNAQVRQGGPSQFFQSILDALPEAVLVFDKSDGLVFWNNRLSALVPGLQAFLRLGMSEDEVLCRLDRFDEEGMTRQLRPGADDTTLLILGLSEESARHRRDAAEGFAGWIWESNAAGEITYLSKGFADSIHDICGGNDTACAAWLEPSLAGLAPRPFRDVRATGRTRSYCLAGNPQFDAKGHFAGFRGSAMDISETVAREERSAEAHHRLVDAIEKLSHGVAIWDADDRLILCNQRFHRNDQVSNEVLVVGIKFEDMVRQTATAWFTDPQEAERWVADRLECHRLGLGQERRYPDDRWFMIKDVRLHDGTTVTTRTDITELKRREQALRESEMRFRAIFQSAAIGVAVVRPGGRITQANQALEGMMGYSAMELTEMHYADLVHPESLPEETRLARRLVTGEIDHFRQESRFIRKDGSSFWARSSVSISRGDGIDRFGIVTIEDIDTRKRAEAELLTFRAVVESSDEAIAILGTDGRITYINPAHERLFGRDLSGALKTGCRQHYSEPSRETIRRELLPALLRGESWEGVLDAVDARGRVFPLWQQAGVVRDGKGKPQCYFAFMHDHSVEREVQDELFKAKETAEQANIAKTRFLAAASHDLRQPLQALSMFVAVLANRNHSPEDASLINRIEDSVNAVEGLLNSLLDVSKLEAGLVVPVLSAFSLSAMMTRLASEFEPLVEQAELTLRVVGSSAVVRSDPALVERILRNLLNNALRYTPKGRILLGCRRRGDRLRVEVWDTGIGIPPSQLKAIFREFHQLGNQGRDRRQGLGLGLAIVERLVGLLGHSIEVKSQPGKGSVFAVELPIALPAEHSAEPRQLSLGIGRQGACIVVIEDEPDVLESMRMILESWNFKVIAASSCDNALAALGRRRIVPDLILTDYRLQAGNTGGQAIIRIRQRLKRPGIPAIIVTGDTAPERLRQAQASGHGLLHKPVHPVALRQLIDELLSRPVQTAARA
jgi:PAS domain S-box-containing protein